MAQCMDQMATMLQQWCDTDGPLVVLMRPLPVARRLLAEPPAFCLHCLRLAQVFLPRQGVPFSGWTRKQMVGSPSAAWWAACPRRRLGSGKSLPTPRWTDHWPQGKARRGEAGRGRARPNQAHRHGWPPCLAPAQAGEKSSLLAPGARATSTAGAQGVLRWTSSEVDGKALQAYPVLVPGCTSQALELRSPVFFFGGHARRLALPL